jgi:ataxin-3
MASTSSSSNETFIYHERQQALLCGQHALNNLIQTQTFTPDSLANVAHQLDQMELNYMSAGNENGIESKDYINRIAEGSGNVDASGNFSIEVLRSALLTHFELTLANTLQENIRTIEITKFDGFICNKQSHWFAIRKINDRFWNLNSTLERPELISHFRLAAEIEALQRDGYSVFCVVEIGMLPGPAMSQVEANARGSDGFWWKECDLSNGSARTTVVNHWKQDNVGTGMRLDGKNASVETAIPFAGNIVDLDNMTEEQMLQMALQQSMQMEVEKVELQPEPLLTDLGAVRLQFRLPDGLKVERRFLKSESTKVLKAYVNQNSANNATGGSLELRFGFPPKLITYGTHDTIESAKLPGEQIQCRYV